MDDFIEELFISTVVLIIIVFKTACEGVDEIVDSDESNSEADFLLRTGTILLRNEEWKTKNDKAYTHNSSVESVVSGNVQEYDFIETDHSEVSLIFLKK